MRQLQQRVLSAAAKRDMDGAARMLHSLSRESDHLIELSRQLATAVDPLKCSAAGAAGHPRADPYWRRPLARLVGGVALLIAALGVARAMKQRIAPTRSRPKVNLD